MDLRAPKLTDVDSRLWPWPLATHKIAGCHTLSSAAFLPFSTSSYLHDAKDIEKVLVKLLIKTIRQGCCSAMSTETSRKFLPGRSKHYTCVSWSVGQDNMGQQRVDGKWWEGKATFGGLAFTRDSLPGLITLSGFFRYVSWSGAAERFLNSNVFCRALILFPAAHNWIKVRQLSILAKSLQKIIVGRATQWWVIATETWTRV